jgi:hypothetical protein
MPTIYAFEVNNQKISFAEDPDYLQHWFQTYPNGEIVPLPTAVETPPPTTGTQTL